MRRSRTATILLYCFFSLIFWPRHSAFAQQPPQANEKEQGIELYRKGAFSEAVVALKEAVKKQQRDSDAWRYLGLSLHRAGEIKDARKAIEKAISLRPDFAPSYTAMAYMQLLSNDDKGAVKYAEDERRQTHIYNWQSRIHFPLMTRFQFVLTHAAFL